MSKAVKKTNREQWARDIRAVHKQTVTDRRGHLQDRPHVDRGEDIIGARRVRKHGRHDLPFDASTAQRLMKISRDARLRKAASSQLLPAAWNTLYELTKLTDAALAQAVGSGAISEQTTLSDARALRPTYMPRALRGPVYLSALPVTFNGSSPSRNTSREVVSLNDFVARDRRDSSDQQPIALPEMTVQWIEREVRVLRAEIERGTIKVDGAFVVITQRIIEQLQDMIKRDRHALKTC